MSALTGEQAEAEELAQAAIQLCKAKIETSEEDWVWNKATLGEASVLLGREQEALEWYAEAAERATKLKAHGHVASMRKQLRLLAAKFPLAGRVLPLLNVPIAVVFTGHMIDAPGRPMPRFPVRLEAAVREQIDRSIVEHNIGFGYCSPACGADILFIECMQARGREVQIVMPFRIEDFRDTSVAFAGDGWVTRYEAIVAGAQATHRIRYCVNEDYLGDAAFSVAQGHQPARGGRATLSPRAQDFRAEFRRRPP